MYLTLDLCCPGSVSGVRIVLILITISHIIPHTEPKAQFVQPLSFGMNLNLAYDVANIFQRPIAATTGFVLSVALALILFFGVITSPFGYFFGIPSRKYVLGGNPTGRRNLEEDGYPNFENSLFSLFSPDEEEVCLELILCIGHRVMTKLPDEFLRVYRFFSKGLSDARKTHTEAILVGLEDSSGDGECELKYSDCEVSMFTMVVRTLISWVPKGWTGRRK